jgi:rare lipoprotein A
MRSRSTPHASRLRRGGCVAAALALALGLAAPASRAQESDGREGTSAQAASETGVAVVYAADLEGRPTASGEAYDVGRLTAAHRSLPFGTKVRVTDAANGRSVLVVINDRWGGPPGQIVNLSRAAADQIGMGAGGQRRVRLDVQSLGDGRRQSAMGEAVSPRALPARVELEESGGRAKQRQCANEAAILGLKDVFYETHVRACLARKPKP